MKRRVPRTTPRPKSCKTSSLNAKYLTIKIFTNTGFASSTFERLRPKSRECSCIQVAYLNCGENVKCWNQHHSYEHCCWSSMQRSESLKPLRLTVNGIYDTLPVHANAIPTSLRYTRCALFHQVHFCKWWVRCEFWLVRVLRGGNGQFSGSF